MHYKMAQKHESWSNARRKLHEIIFEADTPSGKLFDIILMIAIIGSVLVVMLDSVKSLNTSYGSVFFIFEWIFTLLFTIEYILRLISVGRPLKYAASFFGVVDLLAVIPTYLAVIFSGVHYFMIIRILRLLRIFRVLKLLAYLSEAQMLLTALKASRKKIIVFLFTVLLMATILGSVIYVIEGEAHGFTSIPRSVYWAIVTLTTVGYGDISPQTGFGQAIAAIIMILGYGIIAVPTGIVTVELTKTTKNINTQSCPQCAAEGHDNDAVHCKFCGEKL